MTDSDAAKTETIWDAIFSRTIKSKNLVPFCIIFAFTTYFFLIDSSTNNCFIINIPSSDLVNKNCSPFILKPFFYIKNLFVEMQPETHIVTNTNITKQEFAWFSFYSLITLTSIGITKLCDKLGIFKAITLLPVVSDIVYWCILDYREMKDNLRHKVIQYYYRTYTGLKKRKEIYYMESEQDRQKAKIEYIKTHGSDTIFRGTIFNVIIDEELSLKLSEDKERDLPHYRILNYSVVHHSMLGDQNLDIEDFVFKEDNDTLYVANDLVLLLVLLKKLCNSKHGANTIKEMETRINNHLEFTIEEIKKRIKEELDCECESTQTIIQGIQNLIIDMITKSIKWGILEEQKDGTISMPRGMVRYFDIIEYGFFYEGKYPILKCISVPYYFITNNSRLVLYAISIIIL